MYVSRDLPLGHHSLCKIININYLLLIMQYFVIAMTFLDYLHSILYTDLNKLMMSTKNSNFTISLKSKKRHLYVIISTMTLSAKFYQLTQITMMS